MTIMEPEINFNPLEHPICMHPPRRNLSSAWEEHVPFAMYLMDVLRPKVFVELGTFYGVSYCGFCQAVAELELETTCYAVDTWAGDAHMGEYSTGVLGDLRKHHDPLYGQFSSLLQSIFDEAVEQFEDGIIDLLHIDGYHTYDAVKHDFNTWKQKLSRRAVVLFHDTNEYKEDFGVWKFFKELKENYPHFEFLHGHGLGVVAIGSEIPKGLRPLLDASQENVRLIQLFFQELGKRVSLRSSLNEKEETENNLRNDIRLEKQVTHNLRNDIQAKGHQIQLLRSALQKSEFQLYELQQALVFRFILRYRAFLERALPDGTIRRRLYNYLLRNLRLLFSRTASRQAFEKIKSAWGVGGWRLLVRKVLQRFRRISPGNARSTNTRVQVISEASAQKQIAHMAYTPLISVVLPTYNTPISYLKAAIKSVQKQYYPFWELCICDDGSTSMDTRKTLQSITDPKIKVLLADQNNGISAATNQAVNLANGEFIALLDHDDEITPDALFEIVSLLNKNSDLDVIYSDQDKIDKKGKRSEPFYKPDWSPEYFRSVMYVGHLLVIRKELFEKIDGLDSNFDGVQDYELMLRISEQTSKIAHCSKILYHWRMIPGSVAMGLDEKGEKIERLQVEAVNTHLNRMKINGKAERHPAHRHRAIIKPLPDNAHPKVSIIITTKDAPEHISRCLESIVNKTTYPNYNIVVVDNNTTDPQALETLDKYPVKVIPFNQPFNYSRANNLGVEQADGQIIILLNNDTEVITPDWIEQMVFYLNEPSIAAVGPMLVYPNHTIQHAGVVLGMRGTADHVMRGFPKDSDGYAGSLSCPRNVSAVTGACLMMRRDDYVKSGGLSEFYGTHYQDVDLCLRFLSEKKRIVYVPYAVLIHHEGSTRKKFYDHLDRALLLDTWGDVIDRGDPYYNTNFQPGIRNYSSQ